MSIEIVADKYSSAMFELAQEQNILELMEEQLGYVASVMAEQPELRSFLENPIVTEDAKIKLVGSIFESSIDKVKNILRAVRDSSSSQIRRKG